MTLRIPSDRFHKFRACLEADGYRFENRPNQQFLARKGDTVVSLCATGTVVIQSTDLAEVQRVEGHLASLGAAGIAGVAKKGVPCGPVLFRPADALCIAGTVLEQQA